MSAGEGLSKPLAKFLSTSELRKLRGSEQVAAVCYRVGRSGIQFLLVQTRSGRWTFPKGGLEPGLTHAQTAALEAFEEAGVHGRIEQDSFARYVRTKRRSAVGLIVHAYLCEVIRAGRPEEPGRNPTWFSPAKAKQSLQQNRETSLAIELACVIDRAVMRIQRLAAANGASNDELQKVRFEVNHNAEMYGRVLEASLAAFTQCERSEVRPSAALALAGNTQISRLFALGLSRTPRLLPAAEQQYDMSGTDTLAGGPKKRRRVDKGRTPITDGQTISTIASKGSKNRT